MVPRVLQSQPSGVRVARPHGRDATLYWGSIMSIATERASTSALANRWLQLLLAVIVMMAISSPQYTWALFTKPIGAKLHAPLSDLQLTFSLLIILQTFFAPAQAYLVDRF